MSDKLLQEVQAQIIARADWWRTNPDDAHGINNAVRVAMIEVANAINAARVATAPSVNEMLSSLEKPAVSPLPEGASDHVAELRNMAEWLASAAWEGPAQRIRAAATRIEELERALKGALNYE